MVFSRIKDIRKNFNHFLPSCEDAGGDHNVARYLTKENKCQVNPLNTFSFKCKCPQFVLDPDPGVLVGSESGFSKV